MKYWKKIDDGEAPIGMLTGAFYYVRKEFRSYRCIMKTIYLPFGCLILLLWFPISVLFFPLTFLLKLTGIRDTREKEKPLSVFGDVLPFVISPKDMTNKLLRKLIQIGKVFEIRGLNSNGSKILQYEIFPLDLNSLESLPFYLDGSDTKPLNIFKPIDTNNEVIKELSENFNLIEIRQLTEFGPVIVTYYQFKKGAIKLDSNTETISLISIPPEYKNAQKSVDTAKCPFCRKDYVIPQEKPFIFCEHCGKKIIINYTLYNDKYEYDIEKKHTQKPFDVLLFRNWWVSPKEEKVILEYSGMSKKRLSKLAENNPLLAKNNPIIVLSNVPEDEAIAFKMKLEEVGAKVELRC